MGIFFPGQTPFGTPLNLIVLRKVGDEFEEGKIYKIVISLSDH